MLLLRITSLEFSALLQHCIALYCVLPDKVWSSFSANVKQVWLKNKGVVVILWLMESVSIATNVVSSNPNDGEVYSIQIIWDEV